MLNDPLRTARIRKDSQKEQQLICKGLYKPWLVIRNNQQNQTIRKHARKEAKGRRQTLATTPHHVKYTLGLSADPTKHNPQLALAQS